MTDTKPGRLYSFMSAPKLDGLQPSTKAILLGHYWLRALSTAGVLALLGTTTLAYDRQASVFASAAPVQLSAPGVGLSLATTVGNRTVLGVGVLWPEPREQEDDGARLSLDARLLYSSERDTHWYPQIGLVWLPSQPTVQGWAGIGFQRQWTPEVGFFAETLWQPSENQYRLQIGLRIWLDSFSSLDARVRAADPVGAVYDGGRITVQASDEVEELDVSASAAQMTAIQARPVSLATVALAPVDQPKPAQSAGAPSSGDIARVSQADTWYLQLGLFQQVASIKPLVEDPRLAAYQTQLIQWYDVSALGTRVLLGPLSRAKASRIKATLRSQELNSFLYQRPN